MTDVRIASEYVESLTNHTPARKLNTFYIEAAAYAVSAPRVLNGLIIEAVTVSSPPRHVGAVYVEVLTPSQLVFPFKGWGASI